MEEDFIKFQKKLHTIIFEKQKILNFGWLFSTRDGGTELRKMEDQNRSRAKNHRLKLLFAQTDTRKGTQEEPIKRTHNGG